MVDVCPIRASDVAGMGCDMNGAACCTADALYIHFLGFHIGNPDPHVAALSQLSIQRIPDLDGPHT